MENYLVLPFWLAGQHLAVALESVVRVLPALLSTPLPGAPASIRGLVNVQGRILPVIDLALRFNWPSPPLLLWQPFIWLRTSQRDLLLPVERVESAVICVAENFSPAGQPQVPSTLLKGVLRTAGGLLLIQDVEQLLSTDDELDLDQALLRMAGGSDDPA
ncbi:MAG: chemotaxis protein CheW [Pseudomonas sp.]|uniref:chemotaxis protein CheW n=1 Tax=Pseudomonas sp. TaxID=306 RepID=UPI003395335D